MKRIINGKLDWDKMIHYSGNSGYYVEKANYRITKIFSNFITLIKILKYALLNWRYYFNTESEYVKYGDCVNVYPLVWYKLKSIIMNKIGD